MLGEGLLVAGGFGIDSVCAHRRAWQIAPGHRADFKFGRVARLDSINPSVFAPVAVADAGLDGGHLRLADPFDFYGMGVVFARVSGSFEIH